MPRPSMKDQRSAEILDAYLSCVARFGLEGATQERIASEAGMKRPLLRHYLGNRDEMIAKLCAHVFEGFAESTEQLRAALEPNGGAVELVEALFDEGRANDPRLMLTYQALVTSVSDHPEMREPLLDSLARFLEVVEAALRRHAPGASADRIRAVTQGISASYVNLDALSPLNPPKEWRSGLKQAALFLAASLEDTK